MIRFLHTYYTKNTFNCVNLRPRTVREEDALSVAKELWFRCKTSWKTQIQADVVVEPEDLEQIQIQ